MQTVQLLILSRWQSEESHADTRVDWWELIPLGERAPPITTVGGWVLGGEMKTPVTLLSLPPSPLFLLLLLRLLLLILLQLHPPQHLQVSTKPHTESAADPYCLVRLESKTYLPDAAELKLVLPNK